MANFRQNIKTRSGNRIVVTLAGEQVGLVQSLRASDDYSPEAASGIGDIHAQEYVPTMARHTLSVSKMILLADKLRALGISSENGDDVLQGRVFDISIISKDDGAELRKYIGCSFASGDIEVTKHAIVTSAAQFNALDAVGVGI